MSCTLTCVMLALLVALLPGAVQAAPAAPPLNLPPHPRLLVTDTEIAAIKDRLAKAEFLRQRYDALLQSADAAVKRPVNLPPRGGQWYHWYACKKDGAQLKTTSPTQHTCPVCGAVYSGWPWDDVVLSTAHNGFANAIRDLSLAYRFTRKKDYADRARDILLAYADKYLAYPLHNINGEEKVGGGRVGPQTLDESTWLIPVCQGADLVWDALSADDRQRLEDKLFRPAAQVIRQHRMSIHNIQCWKNSAVGLVGLLLNDAELVTDAVSSEHGFEKQIAKGVNYDGQWYEGAWGYHFYTMNAIAPLAEAGERCGLKLYAGKYDGHSYRLLFEGPLNLAMPNMVLPAFSDSGQVNVMGQHGLYELALARYGDARFAQVVKPSKRDSLQALLLGTPDPPAAPPVTRGSRNFPAAGYAVLEHGAGAEATWLCLKYGPHGGGHGHPDKLNFILYTRGKVLAYDPGTGRYGVPLHANWQKTTIAHNTLCVDEGNQKPTTGKLLAFVSGPGAGWTPGVSGVFADAGPIYDGVVYRRAAALCGPDVVLVLDLVQADKEHTLDLAYHHAGKWAAAPKGAALTMPDKPGYRYLEGMVRTDAALPVIDTEGVRTGLAVVSAQGGEVWAGTGAGGNTTERAPCVVVRIQGKAALVGWAMHLGGEVPKLKLTAAGAGATLEAQVPGKTYWLTADPDGATKLKGGWRLSP